MTLIPRPITFNDRLQTYKNNVESLNPLTTKFFNFLQIKIRENLGNYKDSKIKRMLSIAARIAIQALKILSLPVRLVEGVINMPVTAIIGLKKAFTGPYPDEKSKNKAQIKAIVNAALTPFSMAVSPLVTSILSVATIFAIPYGIYKDMSQDQFEVI